LYLLNNKYSEDKSRPLVARKNRATSHDMAANFSTVYLPFPIKDRN